MDGPPLEKYWGGPGPPGPPGLTPLVQCIQVTQPPLPARRKRVIISFLLPSVVGGVKLHCNLQLTGATVCLLAAQRVR